MGWKLQNHKLIDLKKKAIWKNEKNVIYQSKKKKKKKKNTVEMFPVMILDLFVNF